MSSDVFQFSCVLSSQSGPPLESYNLQRSERSYAADPAKQDDKQSHNNLLEAQLIINKLLELLRGTDSQTTEIAAIDRKKQGSREMRDTC